MSVGPPVKVIPGPPDIYVVRIDDVCPNCGEVQHVHAKINAEGNGVAKFICSVPCGGFESAWDSDLSVQPYIDKYKTA